MRLNCEVYSVHTVLIHGWVRVVCLLSPLQHGILYPFWFTLARPNRTCTLGGHHFTRFDFEGDELYEREMTDTVAIKNLWLMTPFMLGRYIHISSGVLESIIIPIERNDFFYFVYHRQISRFFFFLLLYFLSSCSL